MRVQDYKDHKKGKSGQRMKKYLWMVAVGVFFIAAGIYYSSVVFQSHSKETELIIESKQEVLQDPIDSKTEQQTEPVLESVVIYICGAVKRPGVYQLTKGSRISDGITAAGGLCEDAAPEVLNLAAKLFDEQKIYVPTQLEVEQGTNPEQSNPKEDRLDLNTATAEELTMLSGIGQKRAEAIISYRESVGGFTSPEELMEIDGIGEAMYEKIKQFITVGGK